MQSKEVIKIINEIERKIPVDEWVVDGIDVWPYIRFKLGSRLSKNDLKSQPMMSRILNRYILNLPKYFVNNLLYTIKDSKIKECEYLFIENGVQSAYINNHYYYIRTDFLRDLLEDNLKKCCTWVYGYKMEYPLSKHSLFLQFSLDFVALRNRFWKPKVTETKFKGYKSFLSMLRKKGLYHKEFEIDNILKQINTLLRYREYYEERIGKIKPKVVFILCYYSIYGYALISACKRLNIPVVDIQHGVQGDYHYSYGSFEKVPSNGYTLLPDYFYVWSDFEKKTIKKWKPSNIGVLVGGNNYLQIWKDSSSSEVLEFTNFLKKKYHLDRYSKIILYTVHPEEGFDESIIEAIKNSPKDWLWFVRLHPKRGEMLEYTESRIGEVKCSYAIKDVHLLPLYSLLKVVDIHVTGVSSTVMEAAEFGVKSVINQKEALDKYEEYIKKGYAKYVESYKQILSEIESNTTFNIRKDSGKKEDILKLIYSIKKNA